MMPLNKQAFLHLKNMIINNELSYLEIYSETKLSKELGISRTPFRDAIHRLAQEGYIDIIPSKGFRIHKLTKQDVDETFQVRSALECYCTFQIAKESHTRKAKRLFKELDWIMEELTEILNTTQSIGDFCEYDFQFHNKIIDYLQNEQFTSVFSAFMYRMRKLAELSLAHKGRMQDTYDEHMAILTAMKDGDTVHIYEITLKHMDTPRGINLEDL
ncbi:GntR family transcriptional regulator [Lachnospiraceae bacterium MD308]|nr:GntR family transcriptional regulator [Lachnospiraceae bacterium MD308]MCI8579860.1 GntR family transcriptional regulator [Dorea sp.]